MKKALIIFLILCLLFIVGNTGCALKKQPPDIVDESEDTPEETPAETIPAIVEEPEAIFSEAPMLAEMVENGELPPVEERLPINPVIIQPVEKIGIYGGIWRMGLVGTGGGAVLRAYAGYEGLLRWDPEWSRIVPNIAQSYEVNEDASEFTFYLREGLKWSDGVPFTADDILFWYEDLINEELHSSVKSFLKVNDEPVIVEKIDDYTVKFSFARPYGQFPYVLADVKNDWITGRPMHYMKQFHIDHNPEGIDKLIEEAGVEDWVKLYEKMFIFYKNPDKPTMNAWVLTDWYDEDATSVVMERNPYYWKIDTDLNQLPYIDKIHFTIFSSEEELCLAAMEGEIDMQHGLNIATYYEEYTANKTDAEYDFTTLINMSSNGLSIQFNLVHEDPVLRSVFSNKTFRIALSHAINREEVIERIYGMDLEPRQPSPRKESPYYREQLETQYTEFDLSYANELLDEAGYDKWDEEGYRLTPEGQRIEFTITVTTRWGEEQLIAAEMLSEYWHELGILANTEGLTREDRQAKVEANQHDVVITGSKGGIYVLMEPFIYLPTSKYESFYAIPWVYWYEDNSTGEEPPEYVKLQMKLYDQITECTDSECIELLIDQILAIAEEQFYVMGVSLSTNQYMLVKQNFHNVPQVMPLSWIYPTPAPTNPCQYYIDPQD